MTDLYIRHGGIPPLGILVSHSWHEIGAILHIIDTYEVDRFVEIGAHRGGLGLLLHHRHDVEYLGVEIDPLVLDPHFLDVADLIIGDVFLYTIAIRQFIEEGKTPLIYCDGGDKPKEFKVFSEILPEGGLIMVHDYPKEFNYRHYRGTDLTRLKLDFLKGNRQILFARETYEN